MIGSIGDRILAFKRIVEYYSRLTAIGQGEYMSFYSAEYDVYIVLGDPAVPPLWNWSVWQQLLPALDPLMLASRGKPAVRSVQYLPNQGGVVKFGRIGWKEKEHHKWTHGSPINLEPSQLWDFGDVEVWAPSWNVSEREHQSPDVFFAMTNEALSGGYGEVLRFNPTVVLAVIAELAWREPTVVSKLISTLRKVTLAKLIVHRRRSWGKPHGSSAFTDAIGDYPLTGLFKFGSRHQSKVGVHLFAESWQPVFADADP